MEQLRELEMATLSKDDSGNGYFIDESIRLLF